MPSNLHNRLAQPQVQMWGKCSTAVFPKMFRFREKLSKIFLVPEDYKSGCSPRIASSPCVATMYDKLTGGGGCWCILISVLSLHGSSFFNDWSSVCCFFHHLSLPALRFLGQAHSRCERPLPKRQVLSYHSQERSSNNLKVGLKGTYVMVGFEEIRHPWNKQHWESEWYSHLLFPTPKLQTYPDSFLLSSSCSAQGVREENG
jgi:hypothetical protein